jgi:hypothetical protein
VQAVHHQPLACHAQAVESGGNSGYIGILIQIEPPVAYGPDRVGLQQLGILGPPDASKIVFGVTSDIGKSGGALYVEVFPDGPVVYLGYEAAHTYGVPMV